MLAQVSRRTMHIVFQEPEHRNMIISTRIRNLFLSKLGLSRPYTIPKNITMHLVNADRRWNVGAGVRM